ncbi:isoamylase early set domain-containing protein [Streptomyces avidinii]
MLERKRHKGQTEVEVRLVVPAEVPAGDRQTRTHGLDGAGTAAGALAAQAGDRSFRYLAAGDYWFDRDATARCPEGNSHIRP